jgi:hypothetical protein
MSTRWMSLLAMLPLIFFSVVVTDMVSGYPFSKHVGERRSTLWAQMLNSRYDARRQTEYVQAQREFEKYQAWSGFLRRIDDPTILVVLPYLTFSSCLLFSLYRHRARRPTRWAHGLAAACAVCIPIFLYLVWRPLRCADMACALPAIAIPVLTLLIGLLVMAAVALAMKRSVASG